MITGGATRQRAAGFRWNDRQERLVYLIVSDDNAGVPAGASVFVDANILVFSRGVLPKRYCIPPDLMTREPWPGSVLRPR